MLLVTHLFMTSVSLELVAGKFGAVYLLGHNTQDKYLYQVCYYVHALPASQVLHRYFSLPDISKLQSAA